MSLPSAEPGPRPLGAIALGLAILAALLSVTYFLSPLAYVVAAVALPLGILSRGLERTRVLGNAAIALTVLAVAAATATLVVVW